ncbi:hypothetical protein YPPY05_0368, partial [Yersinia pestis PY-05]
MCLIIASIWWASRARILRLQ